MNTERVTRKLSAILSADVEGYSRLMGDDEVATVRTLEAHRKVFADLIEEHRGRVVDSPGDNLLAEFGSVVDAVQCAVEVQQILKARNAELPENRRMQFRIGVNLGDVIQEGARIYGDGVNIAARIESLAEAGGICVSGSTYEQIENKLALGYEYFGEHTVKNIAKPIKVYKVPMEPRSAKRPKIKIWKKLVFAAALVLILGGGALAVWQFYLRPTPSPVEVVSNKASAPESAQKAPPSVPAEPSIAVLPFANISGDPKEDYLSDGITEQIITALSRIPQMLVIARNSVFTYKGKPVMVQQISEELGVRYVLEGSAQKSGDKLRVTAQLIDAKTGNHLWSERYDRNLKDLFELQDDITKNIIVALHIKLSQGEDLTTGKDTNNLEAFLKVMKGKYHQWRFNKNDNEISVQLAKEAIELDPSYTGAYLLLAWNYYNEAAFRWGDTPWQSYEKAIELAKKAITLSDGQEAGAYMALANFYARTHQSEEALAVGNKRLSLDPASSTVNALYGNMLYELRKFREAIPFFKKAIRKDPKPPSWVLNQLGASYFEMRQFKEANQVLKEAIRIDPEPSSWGLALLGASYYRMDKFKEAIPFLKKAIGMNPEHPRWYTDVLGASCYGMGLSYYEADRFEEAITALKEAINLDPEPPISTMELLSAAYYKTDQIEEAIGVLKEAITLWLDQLYPHVCLAATYSLSGRMEEARAQAAEILKIDPQFSLENIDFYDYYIFIKSDKERFINALRKAGLK